MHTHLRQPDGVLRMPHAIHQLHKPAVHVRRRSFLQNASLRDAVLTAHGSKPLTVRAPSSDYNNHMYPASEERQDAYQLSGA